MKLDLQKQQQNELTLYTQPRGTNFRVFHQLCVCDFLLLVCLLI